MIAVAECEFYKRRLFTAARLPNFLVTLRNSRMGVSVRAASLSAEKTQELFS